MQQKFKLTSDIRQRLTKMQTTTYDSWKAFITEFIQNSYRAGAKHLWVHIAGDEITFIDDGVGSRSPKSLLTLDYSEWDSTDEGFGIGFWSILAIPELQRCDVASKKWVAHIDVTQLFANTVPEAIIETVDDPTSGFIITLKSPHFKENQREMWDEIHSVGALQPFEIIVNGRTVPKKSLLDEIDGDFIHDFVTRKFSARFSVSTRHDEAKLYYEKRFVNEFYISGVKGVGELNKKALDLKEPDRKSVIHNEKYDDFSSKIRECREVLYLKFVQSNLTEKQQGDYAYEIKNHLDVSQYEKYILVDDLYTKVNSGVIESTDMDEPDDTGVAEVPISGFAKPDRAVTTDLIRESDKPAEVGKILLKDAIKLKKRKMWCESSEREKYTDAIAKAEYYGCTVFYAKNDLHRRIFERHNVPHIKELEGGIKTTYLSNNVEVKTEKEHNFLKALIPICRHYHLPETTFKIGDLKVVVATYVDEVLVDKETKGCGGLRTGSEIILDRRNMKLKKYHLRNRPGIGTNELKAIMGNMPTISHELAHLLHDTQDNTIQHYETMERIQHEIADVYREL